MQNIYSEHPISYSNSLELNFQPNEFSEEKLPETKKKVVSFSEVLIEYFGINYSGFSYKWRTLTFSDVIILRAEALLNLSNYFINGELFSSTNLVGNMNKILGLSRIELVESSGLWAQSIYLCDLRFLWMRNLWLLIFHSGSSISTFTRS